MTKQVQELTDAELKSIGYESLLALDQNKMNLQIIQTELQRRAELLPVPNSQVEEALPAIKKGK